MRTAMALLVALLIGAPVRGEQAFMDGNKLKAGLDNLQKINRQTATNDDVAIYVHASGYVIGVADTYKALGASLVVCLPRNATEGQVGDVVLKYLDDHPEERHHKAATLALTALTLAFPCSKDKAP